MHTLSLYHTTVFFSILLYFYLSSPPDALVFAHLVFFQITRFCSFTVPADFSRTGAASSHRVLFSSPRQKVPGASVTKVPFLETSFKTP
jgi:hypothetical protein